MKTKISKICITILVLMTIWSCATQNDRHETIPYATVDARNHPDRPFIYRQDVEFKTKSFWLNTVCEENYSIIFHSKTSVFEEKLESTKQYYSQSPIAIIISLGYLVLIVVCWAILITENNDLPNGNRWYYEWTWSKKIEYLRKIRFTLIVVGIISLASLLYVIFGKYLWTSLIIPLVYGYFSFPNKRNIRRRIYFLLKKIRRMEKSREHYSPNDFDERLVYYDLGKSIRKLESKLYTYQEINENHNFLDKDWVKNLFFYIISLRWLWKWK